MTTLLEETPEIEQKHFILTTKPNECERTENFETVVKILYDLKLKLNCKYTQQYVGIKKEFLDTLLSKLNPIRKERKWVECYDIDAGCPLLQKGIWLTSWFNNESSEEDEEEEEEGKEEEDEKEDEEDEEEVEHCGKNVEFPTFQHWELREVKRTVIGTDTIALEVNHTTDQKNIHTILKEATCKPEQPDFYGYNLHLVCSHIYRRIWLINNEDVHMYIDDMKYFDPKTRREQFYVVASIKVFGPLSTSQSVAESLQSVPFLVQPVRSKMMHQVSAVCPIVRNTIEKNEHEKQPGDFHTQECLYDTDPIADEEMQKLMEDVKKWMEDRGFTGPVDDYVARYIEIYRL